jgi:hypothetical protein
VLFLIFIEGFNNPLTGKLTPEWPYAVTVTLTLFWLGFMMNTVNWLDGVDGLAAGVCAVAALMIFIHAAFRLDQTSVSLLPLALFGAALGFLPYNFHPARIFMGSNGALFLGYTTGALGIIGGAKMATVLLVMGLPLLDVVWQIARRVSAGQNPTVGDRGHVHYRLLDLGLSPRQIVVGYYVFCALFGAIALVTASRLFKLIALLVMATVIFVGFIVLVWRARLEERGDDQIYAVRWLFVFLVIDVIEIFVRDLFVVIVFERNRSGALRLRAGETIRYGTAFVLFVGLILRGQRTPAREGRFPGRYGEGACARRGRRDPPGRSSSPSDLSSRPMDRRGSDCFPGAHGARAPWRAMARPQQLIQTSGTRRWKPLVARSG